MVKALAVDSPNPLFALLINRHQGQSKPCWKYGEMTEVIVNGYVRWKIQVIANEEKGLLVLFQ